MYVLSVCVCICVYVCVFVCVWVGTLERDGETIIAMLLNNVNQ